MNSNNGQGKQTNLTKQPPLSEDLQLKALKEYTSEHGVVLSQPSFWSHAIVISIIGVTTIGILWASFAKIEQVVAARGQLKPIGKVKEIQAPVNGVVKEVYVEDGQKVKKGQLLVLMDTTASKAELDSQQKILDSLNQENKFYRELMRRSLTQSELETAIAQLKIPKEVAALARNRVEIVAENQLFSAQLGESTPNLTLQQNARLENNQAELQSREAVARLETEQLRKQLTQNQVKQASARESLAIERMVLKQIQDRNMKAVAEAQKGLAIDQQIYDDVQPLLEEGALARVQIQKQQQQISDRNKQMVELIANGKIELDNQEQKIQQRLGEMDELLEEEKRLKLGILQAQQKLKNTTQTTTKDIRDRLAENDKRLADIDTQVTKFIIDNEKRIAETISQISRSQQTLKYQKLRAPVAGTVFDLQAAIGFVPEPSRAEPLLKIVPDNNLVAEVYITNQDIGFVADKMKTDVRIDSFPFSEFGDVKGEVSWIGSDALPPDEVEKYYRFPAKISLDKQSLIINGKEIPLQSGMSISANIKIREDRTVMSLFTELFTKKVETLKKVR